MSAHPFAARPALRRPSYGAGSRLWLAFAVAAATLLSAACSRPTAWLQDDTERLGIDFRHSSGGTGSMYLPEMMGGGVAVFDYDGDGDQDLFFVNGNLDVPAFGRVGDVTDRLFRHEADGRFTDVTAQSGLGDIGYGTGVAVGDVDNDGHPDVYVANLGPDQLYRNQGDGTFRNVTQDFGIDMPGFTASSAFCDYDRDGFLDLFATQYVEFDPRQRCTSLAGEPDYCGPRSFRPVPAVLLHNEDGRRFTDVSGPAGITASAAAGLGVVCRDLDGDGWLDFYVANDGYANDLWVNQRDGTFKNQAVALGVALSALGLPEAGMGVLTDDLDRDALVDLFVTNLRDETNAYYRNLGPAGFVYDSEARGLGTPSLPFTGFGVVALDLELDGDLDLAIANGRVKDAVPLPGAIPPAPWNRLAEPNLLFLNDGRGFFKLAPPEVCGRFCSDVEISRALAAADLDADGDEDLVLTNIEGPAHVYRNEAPRAGRWLSVLALDPRYKRPEPGTVLTVTVGSRQLVRAVAPATSYLTSNPADVHFGLGEVDKVDQLALQWPDGLVETFAVACVDCAITVRRGEGQAR